MFPGIHSSDESEALRALVGKVLTEDELALIAAAARYHCELEAARFSDRVVAELRLRAMRGELLPSVPPLGYRREGGGFAVDPEEAAVVRRIFELYTSTAATRRRIADELNASGVLGRKWTLGYIDRILANQAYHGYQSVQIEGTCYLRQSTLIPQIVDDDTWQRVQLRRRRPHPE